MAEDPSTREEYWRRYLPMVDWVKEPQQTITKESDYIYKWFKDGELNMCYNCVDRHAATSPDQNAIIYESSMTKETRYLSFISLILDMLHIKI